MGADAGERQAGDMTVQRANDGDTDKSPEADRERPRLVALGGRLPVTLDALRALETELTRLRAQRDGPAARRQREREAGDWTDGDDGREHDADGAETDARIARIESILARVAVVEAGPATGEIAVGAVVTVQDETSGDIATYEIEGAFAPLGMRISATSPVGAALLGRAVGDLVTISLPRGRTRVVRVVGVSASRDAQQ